MLGMRGSAGEGQGREPPASENKGPAAAALPLPKFQEFQALAGGGRVAGMAAGPLTPSSPSAHQRCAQLWAPGFGVRGPWGSCGVTPGGIGLGTGAVGWPWARGHQALPSQKKRSPTRGFPCGHQGPESPGGTGTGTGTETSRHSFTLRPPRASQRAPLGSPPSLSLPPSPRVFTAHKGTARERCPPPAHGAPSSLLFLRPGKPLLAHPAFRALSRPEGMTPGVPQTPALPPEVPGPGSAPPRRGSAGPGVTIVPAASPARHKGTFIPSQARPLNQTIFVSSGAWGGAAAAPRLSGAL